jgi:integrator complex subunit 2
MFSVNNANKLSCIPHPNYQFAMPLFTKQQVTDFLGKELSLTSRSLMLFYIMTVNESMRENSKASDVITSQHYGPDVFEQCNVMEIVQFLQKGKQKQLGGLYSSLLSLIIEQLQHLFHLDLLITSPTTYPRPDKESIPTWMNDKEQMQQILWEPTKDQTRTKLVLDYLCENEDANLLDDVIDRTLPKLLAENNVERYLWMSLENYWNRMCLRDPMRLNLRTLNAFLSKGKQQTYEDVYRSVIVAFQLNKRVLTTPSLLNIFLQIIGSLMIASRKYIQIPGKRDQNIEQSALVSTYLLTQESTIIQLLLETILLCEEDGSDAVDLKRVKMIICSFVHQRFIEQPVIAKLLHFQTYDVSLLPTTVNFINSIRKKNNNTTNK